MNIQHFDETIKAISMTLKGRFRSDSDLRGGSGDDVEDSQGQTRVVKVSQIFQGHVDFVGLKLN